MPGAREVQWWSSGGVRSVGSVVRTEDGKPQEHCFITRKLFLQNFEQFYFLKFLNRKPPEKPYISTIFFYKPRL